MSGNPSLLRGCCSRAAPTEGCRPHRLQAPVPRCTTGLSTQVLWVNSCPADSALYCLNWARGLRGNGDTSQLPPPAQRRMKDARAPAGWMQVNAGRGGTRQEVKGWCLPLCRALEASRHVLCSAGGPAAGRPQRQPAHTKCPPSFPVVLWLPGATGLVAPEAVSLAPPHTPLRQAGRLRG